MMAWENPSMDFDLADHNRMLRETVREFAEQEIAPVAEELDPRRQDPDDRRGHRRGAGARDRQGFRRVKGYSG
jgi:alkylation response protein AidB-like acyl-CoA dehydrogenase